MDYNEKAIIKEDLDKLYNRLETLSANIVNHNKTLIITEGKTDWHKIS